MCFIAAGVRVYWLGEMVNQGFRSVTCSPRNGFSAVGSHVVLIGSFVANFNSTPHLMCHSGVAEG